MEFLGFLNLRFLKWRVSLSGSPSFSSSSLVSMPMTHKHHEMPLERGRSDDVPLSSNTVRGHTSTSTVALNVDKEAHLRENRTWGRLKKNSLGNGPGGRRTQIKRQGRPWRFLSEGHKRAEVSIQHFKSLINYMAKMKIRMWQEESYAIRPLLGLFKILSVMS